MSEVQRTGERPNFPSDRLLKVDLGSAIAALRDSREGRSNDRASVSLIKNGPLNVMLLILKKGAHLKEHSNKGPLALSVLEGAIKFTAHAEETNVSRGQLVTLAANIPHAVEALENSTLLLTTAV